MSAKRKVLIICVSTHHNNTAKIAQEIAKTLNAKIVQPADAKLESLSKYDLIGFGSGIYAFRHHISLLHLIDLLPKMDKEAFIFSTAGIPHLSFLWHTALRLKLLLRGFRVVGEFSCPGFDTFGPLRVVGGIHKGRPNKGDLKNARTFARDL